MWTEVSLDTLAQIVTNLCLRLNTQPLWLLVNSEVTLNPEPSPLSLTLQMCM